MLKEIDIFENANVFRYNISCQYSDVAKIYIDLGEAEKAPELLKKALKTSKSTYHEVTAKLVYVSLYLAQGDTAAARKALEECRQMYMEEPSMKRHYRVSDLILDDRKTGWSRFGLEFAGFLVSPMRGLTRIINGDAWKRRSTSGKQFGVPDVSVDVSLGIRTLELKDEILDKGVGLASEINVEYGDRFDAEDTKPYDYFSIQANLNWQKDQPVLGQINIVGRLVAKELVNNEKHYLSLGLYQHFDYYDSDTISAVSAKVPYKFCTPASVGGGLIYKRNLKRNWGIDGYAYLNAILLGGALSDYYQVDERIYNLASGYSSKLNFNFTYKDRLAISTIYEVYHMFTWKGYPQDINWDEVEPKTLNAQGDRSRAILHAVGLRLDLKLRKQLYLTGTFMNYTRDTKYRYHANVFSNTSEGRIMLTYKY